MNAGKWILVAYLLFAAFIATLVTVCMRQDVNLVAPDYYKKELAYQDQIDRLKRTAALKVKPVVDVQSYAIRIRFDSTSRVEQGTMELFSPSNPKMDRSFALNVDDSEYYKDVSNMLPGMYRLRLTWTMQGIDYFQEEIINL